MTEPGDLAPEFVTDRAVWRFVLKGAVVGLVLGIALALAAPALGLSQPTVLLVASPLLVAVIIQLVRVGVVDVLPSLPAPTPEVVVPEYFVRLRQLERRLESSVRNSSDYEWSIRPMLVELINGKLVNRYGINYRTEPARARTILGDQLWDIMTRSADRPAPVPDKRDLDRLISRIEQL